MGELGQTTETTVRTRTGAADGTGRTLSACTPGRATNIHSHEALNLGQTGPGRGLDLAAGDIPEGLGSHPGGNRGAHRQHAHGKGGLALSACTPNGTMETQSGWALSLRQKGPEQELGGDSFPGGPPQLHPLYTAAWSQIWGGQVLGEACHKAAQVYSTTQPGTRSGMNTMEKQM